MPVKDLEEKIKFRLPSLCVAVTATTAVATTAAGGGAGAGAGAGIGIVAWRCLLFVLCVPRRLVVHSDQLDARPALVVELAHHVLELHHILPLRNKKQTQRSSQRFPSPPFGNL